MRSVGANGNRRKRRRRHCPDVDSVTIRIPAAGRVRRCTGHEDDAGQGPEH